MIRISAPATVDVTPGQPVSFAVGVHNGAEAETAVAVRLVGIDPSWVTGLEQPITLDAGATVDLPVTIDIPAGFPAGAQLVGVEATSDLAAQTALAALELSIVSLEGVSMSLSPATFRGGFRGRFRINVINRGKQPITLTMSGRDPGRVDDGPGGLAFRFKPPTVTLRPGERVRVRASVKGRRPTIGSPRVSAVTVVARSNSAPLHAAGRFTQRPLLSRRMLRMVGLVVVLGMWAGALVTAVRVSQSQRSEVAADASITGDGDGDDGGDGDGDGDGSAGLVPGEEAGTPTGATISGQVSGLPERSGVQVDLRRVSLADRLPEDAELIGSTKHAAVGGKVLARTLQLAPVGPIGPTVSTSTDGEGFWAFGGLDAPANYELTFSKAGFGRRSYVVTVEEKGGNVALEVTLAAGNGGISGTVLGPDGPLGGVAVSVTDGTVTFRTTTPTAGSGIGSWSVAGLTTPGTYLVTAELHGFGTETASVGLGASDSRSGVILQLVPGVGSIAGRVSGGSIPLGGILVTAASEQVSRSVTTLTEAPVGTFSLPQLPIPGTYTVTVSGNGWVSQTQRIDLSGNVSDLEFELVPTTATISGRVTGPDGPLSAVGVTVSQDDPLVKTLSAADPPGSYEVSGLVPGTYVVTFERFGFEPQSVIATVDAGQHEVIDVRLDALPASARAGDAVVRGIVRSSSTGNPIEGVAVASGDHRATSGADGSFTLDGLEAGTYELGFTHARHQPATRTVRLAREADVTIDVTLLPLGGVQGQVTDLTATPLVGVSVSVAADDGTTPVTVSPVTTNAQGEYSILEMLPTGSYVLTFNLAGFQTRTREFEAAAGTVATVDMTLLELAAIEGTIQEPAAGVTGGFTLLDDVEVTVSAVSSTGALTTVSSTTVTAGEYRINNLQPGNYRITASKAGYGTVTKDLPDVKLREVRDGSVILTPGAQNVSGRVFWLDHANTRQFIEGATITTNAVVGFRVIAVFPFVLPQFDVLTTTSDANGAWSIFGPTAGSSSNFTVTAPGFLGRTVSIAIPATAAAGDIELTPVPRDIIGTFTLDPVVVGGTTDVSVTASITSPALPAPRPNESITVRNNGSVATYQFLNLTLPGTYTVTLAAAGYHNRVLSVVVPATTVATTVTPPPTTVQKHSSLAVTVRSSAAGNPLLSGVEVTIAGPSTPAPATTTGTGTVSFSQLLPGAYAITLERAGFETLVVNRTIAAGEDVSLAETLLRFSAVSLSLSRNKNGTVTAGLTGASVTATATVGGAVTPLAEVGTTGVYEVDSLAPGEYTFTATKALHDAASVVLTLAAGTDYSPALTLDAYADLTITARSVFDGTPLALTTATVTATRTGGAPVTLTNAGGGTYTSAALEPGTYTFAATADDHDGATITDVSVVAGADVARTLDLARWPDLTVDVFELFDLDDDDPLAGVAVTATRISDAATRTVTSVGGVSVFAFLAPGSYTITATKDGYDDATPITPLVVTAGSPIATQAMTLARWPDLSLSVLSRLSADAPALETAVVTATPAELGLTARVVTGGVGGAGAGGVYTFGSLAPGTYTITATSAGHDDGALVGTVTVSAGSSVTGGPFMIELLRWPTLAVTVKSVLGVDVVLLEGASVSATRADATPGPATETTNASGVATFAALAPGEYTFTAAKDPGHESASVDVEAQAGIALAPEELALLRWPTLVVTARDLFDTVPTVLAGVTVTVTRTGGGFTVANGTTNASGIAMFSGLMPGEYTVTASRTPGWEPAMPATIDAFAGTPLAGLPMDLPRWPDLTVEAKSTLDSVVTALTGATVTATLTGGSPRTLTETPAGSGTYRLVSLPPGSYTVNATAADHEDGMTSFNVTAGTSIGTKTVTLAKNPGLMVTVKSKLGGDEVPLPGATVTAAKGMTVITLADAGGGNYTSTALANGTWTLKAVAAGHADATGSVGVSGGSSPGPQTLVANRFPTLNVVLKSNTGGTLTNLTGATVTATLSGGGVTTLTDNGGGSYSAALLPPGTYTINASATNHASLTPYTVTATAGTVIPDQPITLNRFPTLTVTVRGSVTLGGTPTFTALTAATVTAMPAVGSPITLGHTGGGVYTAVLPPQTYTIAASHTGYTAFSEAGVGVAAGDPNLTRNPDLPALLGSISGVVYDVGLQPLAGVTVSGVSSGVSIGTPVVTGADGAFSFTNIAPVTWTMTFSKTGYSPLVQSVTVGLGASVTTDPVLVELGGSIRGYTTGQRSGEVANTGQNALVDLDGVAVTLKQGSTTVAGPQVVTSDGAGRFEYSFGGLQSGDYTLTFSRTDYQTVVTGTITLTPGQLRTFSQTLTRTTGKVTVTAQRADGTPITDDPQAGYTLSGPLISPARTATAVAGVAEFLDVPPGTGYSVTVSTLPTGLVEVSPGADAVGEVFDDGADTAYFESFTEVGSVNGTVTKNTGTGAVAASGASVTITGDSHQGDPVSESTTTNASGEYSFEGVPRSDGTGYTITVVLAGFPDGTAAGIAVSRGAPTIVPTVALEETGSLVVTVRDDGSTPVEGATVTITGASATTPVVTDVNGVATFTDLDAGTYTITATKAGVGLFDGTGAQAVGIGQATATITMDREVTLTFTVDDGTDPLEDALVTLGGANTGSGTTDAGGSVTFTGLRPGLTSATVSLATYDDELIVAVSYTADDHPIVIPVTLTLTT
ncbi:MAG TPA: carboxypeptidase regulatory-like domain-containing protein [Acidimicrobiales bacterium]|nr:carboxypeptidase regulatory-like domain-containing protein [Acidimicrobiales bacterium]